MPEMCYFEYLKILYKKDGIKSTDLSSKLLFCIKSAWRIKYMMKQAVWHKKSRAKKDFFRRFVKNLL